MKIVFLSIAVLLMLSPLYSQNKPVLHRELDSIVNEIKDSISQINKRVNNADETYEIAKKYSDSADKSFSTFYTVISIIFAIFLAILTLAFNRIYKNARNELVSHLKTQYDEFTYHIDRLVNTESVTIKIKEKANLIFILDENNKKKENKKYIKFYKTILKEYKNINKFPITNLNDIEAKIKPENVKSKLNIIIMNDDLFKNFWESDSGFIKKEKKEIVENFLTKLESHNFGFVLFGDTKLRDYPNEFKAFANEPYTLYANLNNLLKYMVVVKNIKF